MFKSINLLLRPSNSNKSLHRLIDSDFECEIEELHWKGFKVIFQIANEYEKRNLNVAANLALFYYRVLLKEIGTNLDVIKRINERDYPDESKVFYDKYWSDIQKYFLLM